MATALTPGAAAGDDAARCARGVNASETSRAPLSPLAQARRDCPLLASIIEEYAALDLGEAFPEEAKAPPSPDLATATRFAALGDVSTIARHARLARDAGAKPSAIRELIYLTAVSAGLPKAMEATRALTDVLTPPLATSWAGSREACMRQTIKASILEK